MKPNCIIAARGGSKRVKNKNILNFYGKPMISRVIDIAKKTKLFNRIIVSTDSKKIAKIAIKSGAEIPFLRSKILSQDKVPMQDVMIDTITRANTKNIDNHIALYPTAVLLNPKDLQKAYKKFLLNKFEFLLGIQEFKSSPLRALQIRGDYLSFANKLYPKKNTQDLKKLYHDSGTFWIFKTKCVLKSPKTLPKKTSYYIFKKFDVCDIDDKEDLELAKTFFLKKNNTR